MKHIIPNGTLLQNLRLEKQKQGNTPQKALLMPQLCWSGCTQRNTKTSQGLCLQQSLMLTSLLTSIQITLYLSKPFPFFPTYYLNREMLFCKISHLRGIYIMNLTTYREEVAQKTNSVD